MTARNDIEYVTVEIPINHIANQISKSDKLVSFISNSLEEYWKSVTKELME